MKEQLLVSDDVIIIISSSCRISPILLTSCKRFELIEGALDFFGESHVDGGVPQLL